MVISFSKKFNFSNLDTNHNANWKTGTNKWRWWNETVPNKLSSKIPPILRTSANTTRNSLIAYLVNYDLSFPNEMDITWFSLKFPTATAPSNKMEHLWDCKDIVQYLGLYIRIYLDKKDRWESEEPQRTNLRNFRL